MATHKTRTFKSGNSQAVRLPKALAFPEGTELEMKRDGDVITLRPTLRSGKISFKQMIAELRKLPDVSDIEVRDSDIFPEREGLRANFICSIPVSQLKCAIAVRPFLISWIG